MDICLLCLELRHESNEFIKMDAIKLPDETIEEVIEKHLWPMESISSNAWLCRCCWQILYEFHKFYSRIEEAHEDLANMLDVDTPLQKQSTASNCDQADQELSRLLEEPLSNTTLNGQTLTVGDQSQMILVEENETTSLQIDENQNHSTVYPQTSQNAYQIEAQIPVVPQTQLTQLVRDDLGNGIQPVINETSESSKVAQKFTTKQSEITANTDQSDDEELISDYNEDITKHIKDPLKRPPLLPGTVNSPIIPVLQNSTNVDARDAHREGNKDEGNLHSHSENCNNVHELISEFSNDSESDTNCSQTSLTLEKLNKKLSFYDKLPNNKRDEDDRVIGKNIKLICQICQASSRTFHDLRCHYKNEHNQHGFIKCCGRTFRRRKLLADHMRLHLDPEYFKCQHCGKLMAERRCLDMHITHVHENRGKGHVCDICGNSFGDSGILRNHKMTHLSEEEKKFPCSQCGKNFGAQRLLTNHVRAVHLRKYIKVCDICGKKFQVKIKFERHLLEHKGVPRPTVDCDICGFKSVDWSSLKRHKQAQHPEGGKKEYKCNVCPKISPSLRAHKVHVQYKHELGYNFKCTLCDKAFKRSQSLKEHMATHTQTDLYTCFYCPMTFKSNANMHKHRKTVHPVEWENARREKFSGVLPPTNQKPSTY